MTATEKLRALLDERGVEHYDGTERTLWGYEQTGEDTGIYRFAASEISGGFLQFDMFRITPEQAIAATLGSHERTTKMYRDEHGIWHCAACERGADVITGNNGELDSWHDSWAPNYCPYCGRRGEQ